METTNPTLIQARQRNMTTWHWIEPDTNRALCGRRFRAYGRSFQTWPHEGQHTPGGVFVHGCVACEKKYRQRTGG